MRLADLRRKKDVLERVARILLSGSTASLKARSDDMEQSLLCLLKEAPPTSREAVERAWFVHEQAVFKLAAERPMSFPLDADARERVRRINAPLFKAREVVEQAILSQPSVRALVEALEDARQALEFAGYDRAEVAAARALEDWRASFPAPTAEEAQGD